MMKKLLSLVLAMMLALAPACSLAGNAVQINFSYDYDAEALAPALQDVLDAAALVIGSDAYDLLEVMTIQQMAEAVALLMDSTAFTAYVQPDCIRIECSMQGKFVFNVFTAWDEDEIALTSNLIPDVKLVIPLDAAKEAVSQLLQVNWAALVSDASTRIFRWATSMRGHASLGSFAGDAYTNGVKRVEYRLTDMDFADLFESLLLGMESNESLMALLNDMFGADDVDEEIRGFREYSIDVVRSSEYNYTLGLVYDQNDALIGLSMNVLEDDELITTVSLGTDAEGTQIALVVGIPLGSGVVYLDGKATLDGMDGAEALSAVFSVYQSERLISYQQASADASVLVQRHTWDLSVAQDGDKQINTIVSTVSGMMTQRTETVQTIVQSPAFSFEQVSKTWLGGDKPVAVVTTEAKPSDAAFSLPEGLTAVDLTRMNGSDSAALDAALEKGVKDVSVKLLQALPPQLMTLVLKLQ